MRSANAFFGVCAFAGAAAVIAAGCGSSSNQAGPNDTDASASWDDSGEIVVPEGGSGSRCSPIGGGMCNTKQGLTCCVDLLAAITDPTSVGTCVVESACTSTTQYACTQPSDCMTGQVCCAGIAFEGGAFPFFDAGDASFDAAAAFAAAADASGGGIQSALSGVTAETFCQASCSAGQIKVCATDGDCPSNLVCGGFAGALGGAAGLSGLTSLLGGAGGGLLSLMTCQPPDAGTVAVDAGTTSDDATTGATDTGAPPDANPGQSDAASSD